MKPNDQAKIDFLYNIRVNLISEKHLMIDQLNHIKDLENINEKIEIVEAILQDYGEM